MPIDTLITIPEAIKKYGLTEAGLRTLAKDGKIRAGLLSSGEMVVNEQDTQAQKPTPKEELPEYKKYAHLKGQAIWLSEAERRYKVSNQTISRWVKLGFIKTIGTEGRRLLVDEADVAYCAEIYHKRRGQGKWLFNDDGTPYQKATTKRTVEQNS